MDRRAGSQGDLRELRIVGDESVEAVPDVEAQLQRAADNVAQIGRQPTGSEGDSDEQAIGPETDAFVDRAYDRDASAVAENVLRRPAGAAGVEHGGDVCRRIADDGVPSLRGGRAELVLRVNQVTRHPSNQPAASVAVKPRTPP